MLSELCMPHSDGISTTGMHTELVDRMQMAYGPSMGRLQDNISDIEPSLST
jgi:hypothetical protein